MAKRHYRMTVEKTKKYMRQGRGRGEGKYYRPWLTIHDLSSLGNSHRLYSWKLCRIVHLFSDLELALFYILESFLSVLDICEQFPLLPQSEVMRIIKVYSSTWYEHVRWLEGELGILYIPTSDFRVSMRGRTKIHDLIYTVKPASRLTPHQQLKFQIEKKFWKRRGVTVGIVTDEKLRENHQLFENIRFLRPYRSLDNYPENENLDATQRYEIVSRLTQMTLDRTVRLRDVTKACDRQFGVQSGTALMLANHLLANGWWHVDMMEPYNPAGDVRLLSANLAPFEASINQPVGVVSVAKSEGGYERNGA
jgi:hypothetical protein